MNSHLHVAGWGLLIRIPLSVALMVASALPGFANETEAFFRGRQLTMYLGGGPGASVDINGRILAQHITRFLPGSPTVVVKNLPAAGGVQAYMALAATAPRDGSAFATFARGPLSDPVFAERPANYDVQKFNWIGSLNDDTSICYTLASSRIRTLDDARRNIVTMASTGVLSESSKFPQSLNATIGTRFKVINGYSGAADTLLAIEKGEVDGRCTTLGNLRSTRPDYLTLGKINILVQVGLRKHIDLGASPLASDLTESEVDRQFLDLIAAPIAIDSPFALPPDIPADKLAVWREAFDRTVVDSKFLSDAAKANVQITAHTGPEVEAIVRRIYSASPAVIEKGRAAFAAAN